MSTLFEGAGFLFGTIVGFYNRQIIQLLKRLGVIKLGTHGFCENMESTEEYNIWLGGDGQKKVSFRFHIEAQADLTKFLDPSSDGFLRWDFMDGSYVDLPKVADNLKIERGYIKLVLYRALIYEFYFAGKDRKRYRYYGAKNLWQLNQLKAWTELKGEVKEVESGKKVLDSMTFFGKVSFIQTLIPFLLSMRIR